MPNRLRLKHLYQSQCRELPEEPGIYIVRSPKGFKPEFVFPGTGGWFKGRDPNVPEEKLRSRWVEGADTLYIGKTDRSLRKRVKALLAFGEGKRVAKWGGRYLWQIKQSKELFLEWYVCKSPRREEKRLLDDFKARFKRLPFANLRS